MSEFQGRRVECPFGQDGVLQVEWPRNGDYWLNPNPECGWQAMTPNGHMAGLLKHDVTEHEDGTITVSPSIGVGDGQHDGFVYHGFLTRGVWRDA